jgi:hypothetical protein
LLWQRGLKTLLPVLGETRCYIESEARNVGISFHGHLGRRQVMSGNMPCEIA